MKIEIAEEWRDDLLGGSSRAVRRGRNAPVYCHVRDDRMFRSREPWTAWLVLGVDRPHRPWTYLGTFETKERAMAEAERWARLPWRRNA